jgi:hypothetical protein
MILSVIHHRQKPSYSNIHFDNGVSQPRASMKKTVLRVVSGIREI